MFTTEEKEWWWSALNEIHGKENISAQYQHLRKAPPLNT